MKRFLIIFFIVLFQLQLFPCTTALISGKATIDGRPLLLKHRDSDYMQNKLVYFSDAKYKFIGLVNSPDEKNLEVWGGCNSEGFAIINSASYNLKDKEDKTEEADREGIVMKLALGSCATVDDFEALLKSMPKPLGVEANFGVIDALGNGAYFETNNFTYTKFDVNDSRVAPHGYLIRTNYSFNGEKDNGYGYIRYANAEEIISTGAAMNKIDAEFIFQNLSRSLKHSLTKVDLAEELSPAGQTKFSFFEDFIPRNSSCSSILIQGVKKGETPELATIWTILGFPLTAVAIPTFVKGDDKLPQIVTGNEKGIARLCNFSLTLKEECFTITRGSGKRYINVTALLNREGTGIMQKLLPVEKSIFSETARYLKMWSDKREVNRSEVQKLYEWVDNTVLVNYKKLFNLE